MFSDGIDEFPDYYERNLPHWQPKDALIFYTYRLAGSLPKSVLESLRREKEEALLKIPAEIGELPQGKKLRDHIRRQIFMKYDRQLETSDTGPTWLRNPNVAEIVSEAIHHRDSADYELICFTIMPNHVHQLCINTRNDQPIYKPLATLKSWTAKEANKVLGRSGKFWQRESFDHIVRNGRMGQIIKYILENPVQAGLVEHWRDWPFTFLKAGIVVD